MSEHAQQPSAHKLSDKAWRKLVFGHHSHAGAKSSGDLSKSGERKNLTPRGGKHAPPPSKGGKSSGGSGLADALERARAAREKEEGHECRGSSADDGELVDDAPLSGRMEPVSEAPDVTDGAGEAAAGGGGAAAAAAAAEEARIKRAAAQRTAALKAAAAAKREAEEAAEEAAEVSLKSGGQDSHAGEWWFFSDEEGVHGPFGNDAMRQKYQNGSVHETTLVRFLPIETDGHPPTAEEQRGEAFAPLQELCTASGPPFME